MKRLVPVLLLCAGLVLAPAVSATTPGDGGRAAPSIPWGDDLDAALAASSESGRPVVAYFSYDGCSWCAKMEREVYPDPRVAGNAERFVWVHLPRETAEELHRRFSVNVYPTLVALNAEGRKVHRFSGFREAEELAGWFAAALDRDGRIAKGEPVADFETRDETIVDRDDVVAVPTPLADIPMGICILGDDLWVVQAKKLHQLDKTTGELRSATPVPGTVSDIATDGKSIFLASFGWTQGEPIHVFDPAERKFVRRIVTDAYRIKPQGYRTHGIEFLDGHLWVLGFGRLHKVDPATGEIVWWIRADTQLRALSRSGERLLSGSPEGVVTLEPATMTIVEELPTRHRVRGVAVDDDALYVVGQPVYDFDRDNERVLSWPPRMAVFRLPAGDEAPATRLGE